MKKRKQRKSTLRWLLDRTGRRSWSIVFLVLLQMLISAGSLSYALIFRGAMDAATGGQMHSFFRWILLFLFVVLAQLLLGMLNRFLRDDTQAALENQLKERLFQELLKEPYGEVSRIHSGEWMNRLTSDTLVVAEGLTRILPGIDGMLLRLLGAFALLIALYPALGVGLLLGGCCFLGITALFRGRLKNLHRRMQEADGSLRIFLQENLESMLVIRCFGKEKQIAAQAEERMEEHKRKKMQRSCFSNFCNSGYTAVMNAAYVIGTAVSGYGILTGRLSYGSLLAVVQLIGQMQSPLANMTGFLPQYYSMLASAERLMEIEKDATESRKDELTIEEALAFYDRQLKCLALEDVCFSYPTGAEQEALPALRIPGKVTFPKGSFLALTGPSGCGKSTLLKLLMCLYPLETGTRQIETEGEILPLTLSWRQLFAYVPQGNQLMSGTIREVVTFGEGQAQEQLVWQALRIADAEQFVSLLPQGLDTRLGEHGAGLSEGQLQRIAIARAIYAKRPVLMLDEATSALDEETERRVLQNLKSMTEKTVLIVTHRRAVLDFCDQELYFGENGAEMRNPQEERGRQENA